MANRFGGGNPTGWTNSVKRGEPAARLKAAGRLRQHVRPRQTRSLTGTVGSAFPVGSSAAVRMITSGLRTGGNRSVDLNQLQTFAYISPPTPVTAHKKKCAKNIYIYISSQKRLQTAAERRHMLKSTIRSGLRASPMPRPCPLSMQTANVDAGCQRVKKRAKSMRILHGSIREEGGGRCARTHARTHRRWKKVNDTSTSSGRVVVHDDAML